MEDVRSKIVTFARRALQERGLCAEKRGTLVDVTGDRGTRSPVQVWGTRSRRLIVPTIYILLANLDHESALPPDVVIESDFEDLFYLASLTEEDMRHLPKHAFNADGSRFELLPEQLASILTLSRGAVASRIRVSCKAVDYVADYARPACPAGLPAFNWMIAPPGSGKTVMSLFGAFNEAARNWEECRNSFPTWSRTCRAVDPFIQLGRTLDTRDARLAPRTVFVVADKTTYPQWLQVVRANLSALRESAPEGVSVQMWPSRNLFSPKETFENLLEQPEDMMTIVVMSYGPSVTSRSKRKRGEDDDEPAQSKHNLCLASFFKHYPFMGISAAVMDEFALHTMGLSCPAGRPLIYRAWGVSATPSNAYSDMSRPVRMCNYVRSMLCPDGMTRETMTTPVIMGNTQERLKKLDVIGRFACSDPLMALRGPVAHAVAPHMPAGLDIYNVRVTSVSLAVLLGFAAHDVFKTTMAELMARLHIPLSATDAAAEYLPSSTLSAPLEARATHDVSQLLTAATADANAARAAPPAAVHDGDGNLLLAPAENFRLQRAEMRIAEANRVLSELAALKKVRVPDRPELFSLRNIHACVYDSPLRTVCKFASLQTRCVACSNPVAPRDAMISTCCTSTLCPGCTEGPCPACSCQRELFSSFEAADVPEGRGHEWLRHAMRGIQNSGIITFRGAMRRTSAAAAKAGGKCFLMFTKLWNQMDSVDRKAASIKAMTDVLSNVLSPEAWIRTLCLPSGTIRDRGARMQLMEEFKNGPGVKFLVLHDSAGKDEQITGLDLGFVDCIISIGDPENPFQAFSRSLRTGYPKGHIPTIRVSLKAPPSKEPKWCESSSAARARSVFDRWDEIDEEDDIIDNGM